MSRYNHHHRRARLRDIAFRISFCLFTALVLVLGMPRAQSVVHVYRQGDPWESAPIIATDSFRIWKTSEVLDHERDSVQHHYYQPFFSIDLAVQVAQTDSFRHMFDHLPKPLPAAYRKHLAERLAQVYERGVMDAADYDELAAQEVGTIRIYAENLAEGRAMEQIFTARTAYEYIMAEPDTAHYKLRLLQDLNLSRFITNNLMFDKEKSLQHRAELAESVVPYIGKVKVGEKIVDRGQIVDEYTYNVLRSMERHQQESARTLPEEVSRAGGRFAYALLMSIILLLYFQQFRGDYLQQFRTMLLVALLYIIFPLATYGLISHQLMNVAVIPYCILPICLRIFLDSRTAFVTHILSLLMSAVVLAHPMEFMVIQTVAGLTASFSLRKLDQRSDLLKALGLVILSTLVAHFCLDLSHGAFFDGKTIAHWEYIYLFIAGILSTVAYLLLFAIERLFGFTSNVTLVELSNTNNPILRRLSEEAPGTFQHSLQVANLAAEVANSIEANSQLVRTGALYHDIGKLHNPAFFTENQSGGNLHDGLSPEQSAQIIVGHVPAGLKLAEKHKLPQVIADFIRTHHGTGMAKYFYITAQNQHPSETVDEAPFSYPGPNPHTSEQAILMMADAVEAASRSLAEYTEESLSALVDQIVDGQLKAGYFHLCPITFLDIHTAKEVFKRKLKTIYHTRISYPTPKEQK